jgi:putative DNA primase/helicase
VTATMTAIENVIGALTDAGSNPRETGGGAWTALCPAHEDRNPSLSVRGIEGQALAYCHAGCDTSDVLAALNLTTRDLYDEPTGATYSYDDGRRVHRSPDKKFRQSGATKGASVLYRLPQVLEAVANDQTIYLVEGEKDVHALESIGVVATTAPMGAGSFHKVDPSPLAGAHIVIVADKDAAGTKYAAAALEILLPLGCAVQVVHAKFGKDAADHVAAGHGVGEFVSVDAPIRVAALSVIRLSDVMPERVSWLWEGRIPVGKLVTLDGDPSLGKSTLALAFAAIVTTGGTWPDGTRCHFPGDVVLLAAEDGLADTVRPRLDAAGADVTRVHAVQGVTLPDGSLRPPTLADVDYLHQLVVDTGARLLVVDVLMAYLPSGVDSHKDQDIRRVLSRLATLADATGCTVLLLRHLNKAKGGDPLYRGGGSIGIVGAARAGMLVAKDPDDDQVRVLACTKSNLGREPEGLTYRLTDADEHGVARVEWLGTSTHDARTLLADPGDAPESPERDEAKSWLEDYLIDNGRQQSFDVKTEAWKKKRISDRTLQRAAKDLKVVYSQEGFPRNTYWSLPDSQAKPGQSGPRPQNRGATANRGATGADQRVYEASGDTDSQSRQSRHGSERRRDRDEPPVDPPRQTCTVCDQILLLTVAGRSVCAARDTEHDAARAEAS